jgi:DNA-binding response OmpR family regulator
MNESLRILVVDDEERIRFFLRETLQRDGHAVTEAASGEEALDLLQDTSFEVAILDLMLGGRVDGQRVLEALRWRWPGTITIMITAHGTLDSAVEAIQEGVDGYLLKPVKAAEVRRTIQEAFARRKTQAERFDSGGGQQHLSLGPFSVDLESHETRLAGKPLDLTPSEFKLLVHMIQNAHEVLSPPDMVEAVRQYRPEYLQEARQIIKWYVHCLRKKIESDPSNPRHILNVRGVGYMFEP